MNLFKKRIFSAFPKWLLVSVLIFIAIAFLVSYLKYYFFLYNGLDLAIFNHTFWQTVNGNFFGSSINPPSYFGDHFAPILILLTPIYYFFQNEITLLFLQATFIGISAFPLYLISKRYLSEKWSALLIFSWLLNPFIGSLMLFEWHIISILPFLLLLFWYFFLNNRLKPFLFTLLVILMVREDAGIAAASLAIVMFFFKKEQPRAKKLAFIALFTSTVWTLIAVRIAGLFSITESFKFLAYYGWLGTTPFEIVSTAITSPTQVFSHLFTLDILGLFFIILLPVIYLILLAPVFLAGLLLPLLTVLLAEQGASPLIPFLHYSAWLLPSIYLGTIYGLKKIFNPEKKYFITLSKRTNLIFLSLATASLYFFVTLNPLSYVIYNSGVNYNKLSLNKTAKEIILSKIPKESHVVTTAEFLTPLSSRDHIYYLRYLYSNRYQLSMKPYDFPATVDFILFRPNDLAYYELLTRGELFYSADRGQRLYEYMKENDFIPFLILNDYILYSKNEGKKFLPYSVIETLPDEIIKNDNAKLEDKIVIEGWNKVKPTDDHVLITTYSKKTKEFREPIYFQVTFFDSFNNQLHSTISSQAFGLVSTADWPLEKIIKSSMLIDLSEVDSDKILRIKITPIEVSASNTLDRNASTIFIPDEIKKVGSTNYLEVDHLESLKN